MNVYHEFLNTYDSKAVFVARNLYRLAYLNCPNNLFFKLGPLLIPGIEEIPEYKTKKILGFFKQKSSRFLGLLELFTVFYSSYPPKEEAELFFEFIEEEMTNFFVNGE